MLFNVSYAIRLLTKIGTSWMLMVLLTQQRKVLSEGGWNNMWKVYKAHA